MTFLKKRIFHLKANGRFLRLKNIQFKIIYTILKNKYYLYNIINNNYRR